MNFLKPALSITFALSMLAGAGILDAARADDNPFTPEPSASTETADHGQGSYCSFGAGITGYSCAAPDLTGGEAKGFAAREGKHHVTPTAPSPPACDHGPKGDDGGTGETGGAAKTRS